MMPPREVSGEVGVAAEWGGAAVDESAEDITGEVADGSDRGKSMLFVVPSIRFKLAAGSGYVSSHCCLTRLLSAHMPTSPSSMKGAARPLSVHCDGASMDSTAPMAAPPRKFMLPGSDIDPYARQSRRA